MMHIKNTLMLLDAAVNVYIQRKMLNQETSLRTIESCANDILEYVKRERDAIAREHQESCPTCKGQPDRA